MFSLLYYPGILPQGFQNVNRFFWENYNIFRDFARNETCCTPLHSMKTPRSKDRGEIFMQWNDTERLSTCLRRQQLQRS